VHRDLADFDFSQPKADEQQITPLDTIQGLEVCQVRLATTTPDNQAWGGTPQEGRTLGLGVIIAAG
jgi:hypothetical protein